MFNNQRYLTKGINSNVPIITQIYLWQLIKEMKVDKIDYLQVFTLSIENGLQKIIHTQEEPDYRREYLIKTNEPTAAKIYIIDDETHSTMLLAEEY